MSTVGLIINEKSNRSPSVMDDLLYVARRFRKVRTEVLAGVDGLDRALIGMNDNHVDTLILAGGDGTMQATFTDTINNRRFDCSPRYVALPCGMTNVIANDCGLKGSPASSLDNFLWRREKGNVVPLRRPLLSVRQDEEDPVYGFFLGAGGFHSAVKFSRSRIQTKGASRTLGLVLSAFGYVLKVAFDPNQTLDTVDIEFLEEPPAETAQSAMRTLFMMTTLTKLAAGIFPFWGEGDGAMATTVIDYPVRRLLRATQGVMYGKRQPWFEEFGYHSWRGNQLATRLEGPFVFDGEIYKANKGQQTVFETSHNVDFLN